MKKLFVVAVGLGILATAGATAVSTPSNATSQMDVSIHSTLTAEQAKVLQAKYRYWSSSQTMTLRAPI